MTSLNSNNIINVPKTEVDPNFALPPGVVGVGYLDIEEKEFQVAEDDDGNLNTVMYDATFAEPMLDDTGLLVTLRPPDSVVVLGQSIYVSPDGKFAVDVILDVEDIDGVSGYNVRVSKA